jgi:hypothetical protein
MKILRTRIPTGSMRSLINTQPLSGNPNPLHQVVIDHNGFVIKMTKTGNIKIPHTSIATSNFVVKSGVDTLQLFEYLKGKDNEWIKTYAKYPYLRYDDWNMVNLKMEITHDGNALNCVFTEIDENGMPFISAIGRPLNAIGLYISCDLLTTQEINDLLFVTQHTFSSFDRTSARCMWYKLINLGFTVNPLPMI